MKIPAVVLLLLIPAFADGLQSNTKTAPVGCDKAVSGGVDGNGFPQYDCDGGLSNANCAGLFCNAKCGIEGSDGYCAEAGDSCQYPHTRKGSCGQGTVMTRIGGRVSNDDVETQYNICPYGDMIDSNVAYSCSGINVFGTCVGGSWTTTITETCVKVQCSGTFTYTNVPCTKLEQEITYTTTVPTAECSVGESRCFGSQLITCGSNGQWMLQGIQCDDVCCDYVNQGSKAACAGLNLKKDKGMCVDSSERSDVLDCASEGDFRCSGLIVQKCANAKWQTYETCVYGCNATATADAVHSNFCINHNVKEGGCTSFVDTFCWQVGGEAYYYQCLNEDWVLQKKCASNRCDANSTECYVGCQLWDEMCYGANNTCYYCNEGGTWVKSGICQTTVDNVTMQCYTGVVCDEGSKRCYTDWIIVCTNGAWLKTSQCSYGCSAGSCSTEEQDIFIPLMGMADGLTSILPSIMMFLVMLALVSLVWNMLKRVVQWIRS